MYIKISHAKTIKLYICRPYVVCVLLILPSDSSSIWLTICLSACSSMCGPPPLQMLVRLLVRLKTSPLKAPPGWIGIQWMNTNIASTLKHAIHCTNAAPKFQTCWNTNTIVKTQFILVKRVDSKRSFGVIEITGTRRLQWEATQRLNREEMRRYWFLLRLHYWLYRTTATPQGGVSL